MKNVLYYVGVFKEMAAAVMDGIELEASDRLIFVRPGVVTTSLEGFFSQAEAWDARSWAPKHTRVEPVIRHAAKAAGRRRQARIKRRGF